MRHDGIDKQRDTECKLYDCQSQFHGAPPLAGMAIYIAREGEESSLIRMDLVLTEITNRIKSICMRNQFNPGGWNRVRNPIYPRFLSSIADALFLAVREITQQLPPNLRRGQRVMRQ